MRGLHRAYMDGAVGLHLRPFFVSRREPFAGAVLGRYRGFYGVCRGDV